MQIGQDFGPSAVWHRHEPSQKQQPRYREPCGRPDSLTVNVQGNPSAGTHIGSKEPPPVGQGEKLASASDRNADLAGPRLLVKTPVRGVVLKCIIPQTLHSNNLAGDMFSLAILTLLGPSLCLAFSLTSQVSSLFESRAASSNCRCYPGDACWPTKADWTAFNKTIGGKLVATVPLAAPCHDDVYAAYNNATCTQLQAGWLEPQTQYAENDTKFED
ncbi:hypothetical protein LTS10_009188 [Elasticomyces elasticus]|nr:hypothetical protein LTS10_009188 [Elasticomyces elasticus]